MFRHSRAIEVSAAALWIIQACIPVKSPGDAALARENKLRARHINPTIGVHRQLTPTVSPSLPPSFTARLFFNPSSPHFSYFSQVVIFERGRRREDRGGSAGVRMNADNCNGRSNVSGSGDSSLEREFSGGLGGRTMSTPNSQHSSPSRSLSANSIKVELYSDDDPGCVSRPQRRGGDREEGWKEEAGEKMEEGAQEPGGGGGGEGGGYGDRASPKRASPGPIRLPNGKLKCDVCGMICIGPNVLMVHKRSHTGVCECECGEGGWGRGEPEVLGDDGGGQEGRIGLGKVD
ncbi:hypothetical protein JZ751_021688 [Albula glossodonta]|uniref:C2H2-type domain-containing protein n=1 Tax=Albula glossodonta TaxID=121402 RepID=A0A8T2NV47_9TELE|nr:hypothetical protein JZ751_021688 [Albula glossodonta]